MTTTEQAGLDLAALRGYLDDRGLSLDGELRAELISGGKSNLTYLISDGASQWVLRRPPTAGLTPSAHDVAREYRITAALQDTGVPVARAVALCEDNMVLGAPFTIAEYVAGQVIRTRNDLDALSDAEVYGSIDELVRVVAALHEVDYRAVGLEGLGRPQGYLERQVALWARQWDRVKDTPCPDIERLHSRLEDSLPTTSAASIVHGDYRLDNAILAPADPTTIAAVVDWELSTLGDPLTDVALMCVYRHPAFDLTIGSPAAWTSPRLPSADDIAQRYATSAGRDLTDWTFYLGLAYFKVAVISAGIGHRHRAGATIGEGFDTAADAAPAFAAAGLLALRGDTG